MAKRIKGLPVPPGVHSRNKTHFIDIVREGNEIIIKLDPSYDKGIAPSFTASQAMDIAKELTNVASSILTENIANGLREQMNKPTTKKAKAKT